MSRHARTLWSMLAVGTLIGAVLTPTAATAATTDCGSQITQVYANAQPVAGSMPVLFVHGITSSARVWTTKYQRLTTQVAAVPGVTAWTFDYSQAALDWVTDNRIGPALANGISCLAQASGHPVLVIAHSMGGLATQYAVARSDPNGGTVGSHVADVITIGTPYLGSRLLSVAQDGIPALGSDSPVLLAGIEALLSACAGHAKADNADNPCGFLSVLDSPVGGALKYRSTQIAALPHWQSVPAVLPMAGNIQEQVKVYHWSVKADVGDALVTDDSATAHDTAGPAVQVYCPISLIHPTQTLACYHSDLPTNPTIMAAILATVRSQAAAIAVVPGSHVINRQIYADDTVVVTLTDVVVGQGGQLRFDIDYHNVGTAPDSLSCAGLADAAGDAVLTAADGTAIDATHTYCSDNPDAAIDLDPGQHQASYAIFDNPGRTGPFTFDWQDGVNISGTIANLQF